MLTANFLCVPYGLQPFALEGKDGPFAPVLIGAIDAPDCIAAGSHEQRISWDGTMIYGLPSAFHRERL